MRERFSAEVEAKGYETVRAVMACRVSKKLGPARKQVDLALKTELAGPRPSRWRSPFRMETRSPGRPARPEVRVTPRTMKLPGRHHLRPVTAERCSRRRLATAGDLWPHGIWSPGRSGVNLVVRIDVAPGTGACKRSEEPAA